MFFRIIFCVWGIKSGPLLFFRVFLSILNCSQSICNINNFKEMGSVWIVGFGFLKKKSHFDLVEIWKLSVFIGWYLLESQLVWLGTCLVSRMGENEEWAQPSGMFPNGLVPNAGPLINVLDSDRWLKAEERTAELVSCIQPNQLSEQRRNAVADYVQRLIMKCFPCQVVLLPYYYIFA